MNRHSIPVISDSRPWLRDRQIFVLTGEVFVFSAQKTILKQWQEVIVMTVWAVPLSQTMVGPFCREGEGGGGGRVRKGIGDALKRNQIII